VASMAMHSHGAANFRRKEISCEFISDIHKHKTSEPVNVSATQQPSILSGMGGGSSHPHMERAGPNRAGSAFLLRTSQPTLRRYAGVWFWYSVPSPRQTFQMCQVLDSAFSVSVWSTVYLPDHIPCVLLVTRLLWKVSDHRCCLSPTLAIDGRAVLALMTLA
jgi:hypothetical protein